MKSFISNIVVLILASLSSYIYHYIPVEYNLVDWKFVFAVSMGVLIAYIKLDIEGRIK